MAFPTVAARAAGQTSGTATTHHAVPLPSGIQSGDLLLVFVAFDTKAAYPATWPSGWIVLNNLFVELGSPNHSAFTAAVRFADGSEGSTVTVTASAKCLGAYSALRVTGARANTLPAKNGTFLADEPIDPPPLTLSTSSGINDYLWIAACGARAQVTGAPQNYDNLNGGFDATTQITCKTAERLLTAQSEDPGPFATSASGIPNVTVTYAVFPATPTYQEFPTSTATVLDSVSVRPPLELLESTATVVDSIDTTFIPAYTVTQIQPTGVGVWYPNRQQYFVKFDPNDQTFYVLSRREIIAENVFTGERSRVVMPWARHSPIPGSILSVWSSGDDDGRLLVASGSQIRVLDFGSTDLGAPYTSIIETAPISFDVPGDQGVGRMPARSRSADPRSGLIRAGQVRRIRFLHTTTAPQLVGAVRYVGGAVIEFVEPASSGTTDRFTSIVLDSRESSGRHATIRLELNPARPSDKIHIIELDVRLKAPERS